MAAVMYDVCAEHACVVCIMSLSALAHRWLLCGCMWTAPQRISTTQFWLWFASRKGCCPGRFLCSSKDCKWIFPQQLHYFCCLSWPRPSLAFSLVKEEIRLLECWHVMHAECMPWPVPLCSVSFSFANVLINTLPRFVAPGRTCSILILSRMLSCSYLVSGPVTEYLSHTQMNNTSPILQNVQWVCFLCPIFMHTSKR